MAGVSRAGKEGSLLYHVSNRIITFPMSKVDDYRETRFLSSHTLGRPNICEIQLSARSVLPEVDDHVVAFSNVHSNCARSINDLVPCGWRWYYLHLRGCHRPERAFSRKLASVATHVIVSTAPVVPWRSLKVPLCRCRSSRENAEPVLSVPEQQTWAGLLR